MAWCRWSSSQGTFTFIEPILLILWFLLQQNHALYWTIVLQDEVRNLIKMTLGEREREIIYLYYGLDNEYLTWEDISRRYNKSTTIQYLHSIHIPVKICKKCMSWTVNTCDMGFKLVKDNVKFEVGHINFTAGPKFKLVLYQGDLVHRCHYSLLTRGGKIGLSDELDNGSICNGSGMKWLVFLCGWRMGWELLLHCHIYIK